MNGGGNCGSKSSVECKDTPNPINKSAKLEQIIAKLRALKVEREEAIKDVEEKKEKMTKAADLNEYRRAKFRWEQAKKHLDSIHARAGIMFATKMLLEKNAGKRNRNRKTIRKAKWGSRTTSRRF